MLTASSLSCTLCALHVLNGIFDMEKIDKETLKTCPMQVIDSFKLKYEELSLKLVELEASKTSSSAENNTSSGSSEEQKLRIDEMVKEIDKCIAILNTD